MPNANYPASKILQLNQNNTCYTYTIIKEGFYPPSDILQYTSPRSSNNSQFKIPDDYLIQTSWGRGSSSHTVQCEINYLEKAANFKICFGDNFQTCVNSAQSATDAANAYLKVGSETKLSGVHVFCLNGQELERNCEKKHRTSFHKPFNELTINCFHPGDNPVLQEIHFSIQGKNNFQVNFEAQDIEKENQRNEAFTKINEEMNHAIPVSILNISELSPLKSINEDPNINDPEVVEVLKYIGKAGYRQITDILLFIIPGLVKKHILNPDNLVINLRISGDGRNVGRKVKHVMVTCAVLDDISNIYKADFHYTIILYPGVENYEILQKVMEQMINELHNLVTNGLISLILADIGNKEKAYKIEKNMDQLQTPNPPPGHLKVPILPMIPLNNYVPDELHVMLRIWDRMWALVIQELKSKNQFNDHTQAKIIAEMHRISVWFHFWQDQGTRNWVYTSLMVKEYGAINSFTTETYELLHRFCVKIPYRMSNHRDVTLQIVNTAVLHYPLLTALLIYTRLHIIWHQKLKKHLIIRAPPLFTPDFWSVVDNIDYVFPRTQNFVEAWDRRWVPW
nr:7262_t:CDS:2 [Entrophospora candida]